MNKRDLVNAAARKCCSKKEASQVVDVIFASMRDAVAKGNKVVVSGFGSFNLYQRKERKGVHPRRPEEAIIIPAMKLPRFTASKDLRKLIS